MPIITKIPGADQAVAPVLERPRERDPSTIVMSERRNSVAGMSSYLRGSPLVVEEYFKQYLLKDDLPRDFDDQASGIVQQYHLVRDLVLRVTSLAPARQDVETGVFQGSQTAMVPADLAPYVGDLMVVRTLTNRRVLYRVSRVERLTIIEASTYQIEFEYMRVLTSQAGMLAQLRSQIVFTSVFDASRAAGGGSTAGRDGKGGGGATTGALVPLPTFESIGSGEALLGHLVSRYMDEFFDMRSATLLWSPTDAPRCYDPWLVRYAIDNFESDRRTREICHYSGERWDSKNGANSIYSAIQQRRPRQLARLPKARAFTRNVLGATWDVVAYQDIDWLSLPVAGGDDAPAYVFPAPFYADAPATTFECAVLDHINRLPIDPAVLVDLASASEDWSNEDRYYRVPILVGIMSTSIKESTW